MVALFVVMRNARSWRVTVTGDSMLPSLRPGDRLVCLPLPRGRVRAGDVVMVPDPRRPSRRLLKRVAARHGERVTLLGDHPAASTDSRTLGDVPLPWLVPRAVYRYAPADRVGVLGAHAGVTDGSPRSDGPG